MAFRLFETANHAKLYGESRPSYPPDLYEFILKYHRQKHPETTQLLDVGCGTGQSTHYLAKLFNRVLAADISEAQIEEAKNSEHPGNIKFVVSPAESIPLEDNSVDLITCGQSFHWFDAEKFYDECRRLLKPGGCLALYGYLYGSFGDSEIQAGYEEFESNISTYMSKRIQLLFDKYRDVSPPFEDIERNETFVVNTETTAAKFVAYVRSWSAYQLCMKDNKPDLAEIFKEKILKALKGKGLTEDSLISVPYHSFVVIGRKSS